MYIPVFHSSDLPNGHKLPLSVDNDAPIKSLEQKLQKLKMERQIQEIKNQFQQLKQQEKVNASGKDEMPQMLQYPPRTRIHIDIYA